MYGSTKLNIFISQSKGLSTLKETREPKFMVSFEVESLFTNIPLQSSHFVEK